MSVPLRDYQIQDVLRMTKTHRVINALEPGLGKTLETLEAALTLSGRNAKPDTILIVGPRICLGVWQQELLKWYDRDSIIYRGTKKQRAVQMGRFLGAECEIVITTYKMLDEILTVQPDWDTIIADEIHLGGLLNHKTAAHKAMKKLRSKNLFLLTGTPVRRDPADLFAPLNLLAPERFASYWQFVSKHCIVIDNGFGRQIEPVPAQPVAFKEMLAPYMIRRLKKDVLHDLPDKIRQSIPLEMNSAQKALYDQMVEEMYLIKDDGSALVAQNVATQILRLRQLLVTPQMLGIDEDGEGLDALAALVDTEFGVGRSVLVCTPFRQAVPYIKQALQQLTGNIFEIHGEVKEHASTVAQRFQDVKSHKKVLIITIKSGAAFTAHSASTAFFLGYEWSAIDNKQAEDRIHRLGQKDTVFIKYLLFQHTVDELVMTKLDNKQHSENWILNTDAMLQVIRSKR